MEYCKNVTTTYVETRTGVVSNCKSICLDPRTPGLCQDFCPALASCLKNALTLNGTLTTSSPSLASTAGFTWTTPIVIVVVLGVVVVFLVTMALTHRKRILHYWRHVTRVPPLDLVPVNGPETEPLTCHQGESDVETGRSVEPTCTVSTLPGPPEQAEQPPSVIDVIDEEEPTHQSLRLRLPLAIRVSEEPPEESRASRESAQLQSKQDAITEPRQPSHTANLTHAPDTEPGSPSCILLVDGQCSGHSSPVQLFNSGAGNKEPDRTTSPQKTHPEQNVQEAFHSKDNSGKLAARPSLGSETTEAIAASEGGQTEVKQPCGTQLPDGAMSVDEDVPYNLLDDSEIARGLPQSYHQEPGSNTMPQEERDHFCQLAKTDIHTRLKPRFPWIRTVNCTFNAVEVTVENVEQTADKQLIAREIAMELQLNVQYIQVQRLHPTRQPQLICSVKHVKPGDSIGYQPRHPVYSDAQCVTAGAKVVLGRHESPPIWCSELDNPLPSQLSEPSCPDESAYMLLTVSHMVGSDKGGIVCRNHSKHHLVRIGYVDTMMDNCTQADAALIRPDPGIKVDAFVTSSNRHVTAYPRLFQGDITSEMEVAKYTPEGLLSIRSPRPGNQHGVIHSTNYTIATEEWAGKIHYPVISVTSQRGSTNKFHICGESGTLVVIRSLIDGHIVEAFGILFALEKIALDDGTCRYYSLVCPLKRAFDELSKKAGGPVDFLAPDVVSREAEESGISIGVLPAQSHTVPF